MSEGCRYCTEPHPGPCQWDGSILLSGNALIQTRQYERDLSNADSKFLSSSMKLVRKSLQRTFYLWLVGLFTPLRITGKCSGLHVAWATPSIIKFNVIILCKVKEVKEAVGLDAKTKQNKQKTPASHPPHFALMNLDTTPSWEAWLSLREFYLSLKVTELGLWNAMPLRTLETYIQPSISDEKTGAQKKRDFSKLHSKSMQSWAQSAGLTIPWAELLSEL